MLKCPRIDLFRRRDHEVGIAQHWSPDGKAKALPLLGGANRTAEMIRDFLPADKDQAALRMPDLWWRR